MIDGLHKKKKKLKFYRTNEILCIPLPLLDENIKERNRAIIKVHISLFNTK